MLPETTCVSLFANRNNITRSLRIARALTSLWQDNAMHENAVMQNIKRPAYEEDKIENDKVQELVVCVAGVDHVCSNVIQDTN